MFRPYRCVLIPPSPGPSSDVAWLEEVPGGLANLNLNPYELDLLLNQVTDAEMDRSNSGRFASSSGGVSKTANPSEKVTPPVQQKRSSGGSEQGLNGRGVLAANVRRVGFLEAEKEVKGPFKLSNLCVGLLGSSLEDLMEDLEVLGSILPPNVKAPLIALARRRGLLDDRILMAFADESFELLDVSGMSWVTDKGILAVTEICKGLRAVDIRCCPNISSRSVQSLVRHCPELHTLRLGGNAISNRTAQRSIKHLIPQLRPLDESPSWEELNVDKVVAGAGALDWLVWPSIDKESLLRLERDFPRVSVNPKPRRDLPYYARTEEPLDGPLLDGIDPTSWLDQDDTSKAQSQSGTDDPSDPAFLSIAERFRLAYVERYERSAAKRAKNGRQRERRAEKELLAKDVTYRARNLASMVH